MESIHVRQTVRPIRFAFLVERGDFDSLLQAVSLNTAIWGGMYNPIVGLLPDDQREGLLKSFDPDYLVHISGQIDPALQERFQFSIVERDALVATDHQSEMRYLRLGVHIGPLLQKIHREETRFLQRPSRAVIVETDEPAWSRLVPVVYGSFAHLPEQDVEFRRLFLDLLRASEATANRTSLPADVLDGVSPVDSTRYDLSLYGGQANFSSHILYVGDPQNWDDLVEFWNIRATGRHLVFLPTDEFHVFEPIVRRVIASGDYPINPHVRNHADLQKAPSATRQQYEAVADWIAALNAGPFARRTWDPRFGMDVDFYVGDIHAANVESSSEEEVALWDGTRLTPVKTARPTLLSENSGIRHRDFRWAIELTMRGSSLDNSVSFTLPSEPGVETLVRHAVAGLPGDIRISRRGLVITEDFPTGHLYLNPLQTDEMFAAIFEARGFDVEESQPGRYAAQIIAKMGNLHFDCRMFKVKGVREIINRLSNGSILTKGNMHDIVTAAWQPDANDDLHIRRGQRQALDFGAIFDELLDKRIIRPGFSMKCSNCFAEDWYHVSEFAEEFTCRFCFTRQRVNFGAKHEWQYKADGLFQIRDSALGSLAVIISLWRFAHLAMLGGGKYATSLKLKDRDTGKECEIDFVYLQTTDWRASDELVFGESAGHIDLTQADADKMRALADRFDRRPYLAFSTLKDEFSDAEKTWLRKLSQDGYKVIALTRPDLDLYDLHKRFEHTSHRYAVSLSDLSRNTLQLNLN
jgi:hypothetical protein